MSVGTDYLNDLVSFDVLNNFAEKLLRFAVAPPDLKRAVKVTGQHDIPVLRRMRDNASYATFGRWLETIIVDKDIDSREWAEQRGKAELAKYAAELNHGVLTCLDDGLEAGQLLHVTDATRGVDDDFLIQKVHTQFLGNGQALYTVEFGQYKQSLVDMLVALRRKARQHSPVRDDEILNELLETSDTLALADTAPTSTPLGKDYYCDPDGLTADAIVCGQWAVSP